MVGHHTFRGGQDGDPHSASDARDFARSHIDPQTGLTDPTHAGNHGLAFRNVPQADPKAGMTINGLHLVVTDETFGF